MQTIARLLLVLMTALPVLSVIGCSDGSRDRQQTLEESLAKADELRKQNQWKNPAQTSPKPSETLNDSNIPTSGSFTVKVESSMGDYIIEVHRDWAPVGAERFYQLVKSGFYDDCRYFRVMPGFMVQFGINGNPAIQTQWGSQIKDDRFKQSNKRGYVTFAMRGANTRTTQIFINYVDNSDLDSQGFTPFGQVIEGMPNVNAIFSAYGERPDQEQITLNGNDYLNQAFPELDFVKKMSLVSDTTPPADNEAEQKAPAETP